jgi:hypothetical protein
MSDLLFQLLTLFITLIGFGIILSLLFCGADGPKKFLSCLIWPFKAFGWMAFGVVLLIVLGAIILQVTPGLLERLGIAFKAPQTGESAGGPSTRPQPISDRYPALRQTDRSIYAADATYETWNQTACLHTVYLMLMRGDHDPNARLDASWFTVDGEALKPSGIHFQLNSPAKSDWDYTRPYDPAQAVSEIRAGRTVLLNGVGGKPVTHWVLAVDIRGEPPAAIIYNDPWVGAKREIPVPDPAPEFQGIAGSVVTWMRLIATE